MNTPATSSVRCTTRRRHQRLCVLILSHYSGHREAQERGCVIRARHLSSIRTSRRWTRPSQWHPGDACSCAHTSVRRINCGDSIHRLHTLSRRRSNVQKHLTEVGSTGGRPCCGCPHCFQCTVAGGINGIDEASHEVLTSSSERKVNIVTRHVLENIYVHITHTGR